MTMIFLLTMLVQGDVAALCTAVLPVHCQTRHFLACCCRRNGSRVPKVVDALQIIHKLEADLTPVYPRSAGFCGNAKVAVAADKLQEAVGTLSTSLDSVITPLILSRNAFLRYTSCHRV